MQLQLTREILAVLCEQHSVSEETDKLISRYCVTLERNRSDAKGTLCRLKQYTLWLRSEGLSLQDSSMAVIERYGALMNECFFTVGRKTIRLMAILKFLSWCKANGYLDWDDTDKPLSMDELQSRSVFGAEPPPTPLALYEAASRAYARGTTERGFAIMRLNGVEYKMLLHTALQDLNVNSRLRISAPEFVIQTPEFQDREDVLAFLSKEAKVDLTEPIPPHLRSRAVVQKTETAGAIANGRYEALAQLVGLYATTRDRSLLSFIEIHFPTHKPGSRYKKCKWLSAGRASAAAAGRMTSGMVIALYRERLPW